MMKAEKLQLIGASFAPKQKYGLYKFDEETENKEAFGLFASFIFSCKNEPPY